MCEGGWAWRWAYERGAPAVVIERQALAQTVKVADEELIVELEDGRAISVPLTWFPRLFHGCQRNEKIGV